MTAYFELFETDAEGTAQGTRFPKAREILAKHADLKIESFRVMFKKIRELLEEIDRPAALLDGDIEMKRADSEGRVDPSKSKEMSEE
mmetsp:Transcript_6281/g.10667  ORF Transcript_6281/g.10667 Transcript_6281/m.10667 type:complete len:87 (-) Transcript_6281:692-952(-)